MLRRIWTTICDLLRSNWEAMGRAAVSGSMWVEGYTDDEIDEEVRRIFDK